MECLAPYLDFSMNDRPGEKWRDVVGYEGYYLVSTHGRVKSEPRLMNATRGEGFFVKKGRILKQYGASGRFSVVLNVESVAASKAVPTLVADAFLRKRMANEVVMHRNKISSDNTLTNLEISTRSESTKRNYEVGSMCSTVPVAKNKYKPSVYGIYKGGQLIGRVCKCCKAGKCLDDFYNDISVCNDCHNSKQTTAEKKQALPPN